MAQYAKRNSGFKEMKFKHLAVYVEVLEYISTHKMSGSCMPFNV